MTASTVTIDTAWWAAFLLMLCRSGGWLLTTPLFGTRGVATVGRVSVGIALSMALAPTVMPADLPTDVGGFLVEGIVQFVLGAGFGWLTSLLLYAPQVAGTLADNLSGLGYSAVVDPQSGQQASIFSRLFNVTFIAMLFATTGYQSIILGFGRSVQALGVGARPELAGNAPEILAQSVTALLRAAIEVGAPLLGALLLTDAALGIASRFFPQANITFIGLSLKALVAIFAAGLVLTMLPGRVDGIISFGDQLVRAVLVSSGGG